MQPITPHPALAVKDIEISRPLHWLALAWKDMERCPTAGAAHGLILAIVAGSLFWFARHDFWWIAAMLSVSMIIAPLLATGLYDISRRLERGEEATLADAFRIWTCGDKRLIHFGLLLALSSAGWMASSAALIQWMLPASVHTPADFVRLVVLQPQFGVFELWVILGALLAAPMFASTLVTIPLLMDHPTLTVQQAMLTSWRVVAMNPFAMACWAGILCVFTALGIGSAFLGLLGVVPMLGHASWHAYRDLVVYDPSVH
ncbi:MAG: hypothetical protein RLZ36_1954 [Pseudomonadota bacterium]|jgi:uncharacterized membrane protein